MSKPVHVSVKFDDASCGLNLQKRMQLYGLFFYKKQDNYFLNNISDNNY